MRLAFSTLFSSTLALLLASTAVIAAPQTYLTVYGEPAKYPAGFSHFDYTNPNAPKGGSLRRSAIEIGRFDHVLPYIDKGIGVSQVDGWLYSPLAQRSWTSPTRSTAWWPRRWSAPTTACRCASTSTPRHVSPMARSPPKTCATPSTC
jgi:ABC-type oligopeptide transport system substrate-binding subunit